jgi:hypothetical protein
MKTKIYSQATKGLALVLLSLVLSSLAYSQASTITVVSPNGGENWLIGSSCTITCEYTGEPASGMIEYSEDGGQYWYYLDYIYALDSASSYTFQNYIWATTQAKIRIADAADSAAYGLSPVFSITELPVLNLVTPNGGEVWNYGEYASINWTGTNLPAYV